MRGRVTLYQGPFNPKSICRRNGLGRAPAPGIDIHGTDPKSKQTSFPLICSDESFMKLLGAHIQRLLRKIAYFCGLGDKTYGAGVLEDRLS
jgi:hypothetical protein